MAGAYCKFCGRRCFVHRVLPDGSWSGHLATCAAGMEHDRQVCGHDHTTAINPLDVPAAGPAPTGHLPHTVRYTLGGFAVPVAPVWAPEQPIHPLSLSGGDVMHARPPLGDPCEICAGCPAAPCHVEPADPCHPDVMTLCASCAVDIAAEEAGDDAKSANGAAPSRRAPEANQEGGGLMPPNRVIFGDQVTPGVTLLIECRGRIMCRYPGPHDVRSDHEASILHLRQTATGPSAVVVDSDGQQHGWEVGKHEPVRVLVTNGAAVNR